MQGAINEYRPLKEEAEEMIHEEFKLQDQQNSTVSEKISSFINSNARKSSVDQLEELKRQLKKKYLNPSAIQSQKKIIASRLFYFPSKALVQEITKIGKDPQSILFKSLVMRHGDLSFMANKFDENLQAQVQYAIQNVRNWGTFYFDVNKLERNSSQKSGDMKMKKYQLDYYQIQVSFITNIYNSVAVKYKQRQISSNQFKNKVLQELAEKRLRQMATQMYYQYLKIKNNQNWNN